jgi:hypothetical protein
MEKTMKKLLLAVISLTMTAGAYAGDFSALAVNAAGLKDPAAASFPVPEPAAVRPEPATGALPGSDNSPSRTDQTLRMILLDSEALKSVALLLRGLQQTAPGAAPIAYSVTVQEISSDLEAAALELRENIEIGDSQSQLSSVYLLELLTRRLAAQAANVQGLPDCDAIGGREVKRIAADLDLRLELLRSDILSSFKSAPGVRTQAWANEAAASLRAELKLLAIDAKVTVSKQNKKDLLIVEFRRPGDYEEVSDMFYQDPDEDGGAGPNYMSVKVMVIRPTPAPEPRSA